MGLDGSPSLAFQPAVDLATGRLLGFEALLRWRDSSGENIPPDVLIPRAEAHGRMNALNQWVLTEACRQAAKWPSDFQLAVNCSVFQLRRGNAAMAAASAIEQSGLNPDRLTVEVTEISVADEEAAVDLQVMTRLGIQLTVDDVGSDWSVLEDLRGCVVNTVKIDAALVAGLTIPGGQSRAIVETIVKLSDSLGLCTVAEAVETADQVAILRELGVEAAQGYFFSPPLTANDAFALASMSPPPGFALSGPTVH
jgi:EAL domain-containing protein (putative c-di-GMP-specific phosphodiesterase class I)